MSSLFHRSEEIGNGKGFLLNRTIIVRVSIPMMKHYDHKQLGEKRVCFDYISILKYIIKGSQGRNSRQSQEPGGRNRCRGHGGVAYSPWLVHLALL